MAADVATQRAWVAGATGYTGQAVVRTLREHGIETVAHVRPDSKDLQAWTERFASLGARTVSCAWQPDALTAAMQQARPTLIFALLGTTAARAKALAATGKDAAAESYEAVDYRLTRMLLDAALTLQPRPRFVYLSSMGAQSPGPVAYLRVRHRMEAELRASGIEARIARPAGITGPDRPEDRPGERVSAAITDLGLGALAAMGIRGPRARYGSMDAATLARGLVRCALDPAGSPVVVDAAALRQP